MGMSFSERRRRRHMIMANVTTMVIMQPLTAPTIRPMLLDLLAPVVDVSPEPAAIVDNSDVDALVEVVLTPEGV